MAVCVAEASSREAAAAWESTVAFVMEAEARATTAEREARERVSKMEAESAAALAYARGEVVGFTRRIALLECELVKARQAQDTSEVSSWGLFDAVVNADRQG
jgi:hypothetical protein